MKRLQKSAPLQSSQVMGIILIGFLTLVAAGTLWFLSTTAGNDSTSGTLLQLLGALFLGAGFAWIYTILTFQEIGQDEYRKRLLVIVIVFTIIGVILLASLLFHINASLSENELSLSDSGLSHKVIQHRIFITLVSLNDQIEFLCS